MKKKRIKNQASQNHGVDLNVMPFVDIFSLLCTFLLFTAVFVSIGILEVQVPFLTNAAPSKESENKRSLSITISVDKNIIEMKSIFDSEPYDESSVNFENTDRGITNMHKSLISKQEENKSLDLVTLFVDDNVAFKNMVKILDHIKLKNPVRRTNNQHSEEASAQVKGDKFLIPKVIMGNIIL